ERAAAAQAFESAARAGQIASLISQERPDVFTSRVANIPPGTRVVVTLSYHELLRHEHGRLSLVVPSTSTPRDGSLKGQVGARSVGLARFGDVARLSPPVALDGSGPLLDVSVELDPDVALDAIESPTHEIELSKRASRAQVRLREGPVLADRDFELRWRPAPARTPTIAEDGRGARYALAIWSPAFEDEAGPAAGALAPSGAPRDITFLVDTSLSMAGAALSQASAALGAALSQLTPRDYFNVIEVGSKPRALFDTSRPASALNVARALERAARLTAAGEAAMLPALALALEAPSHAERSERVVLISDGSFDDERQLPGYIEAQLASRRLFTVGAGPAPARFVLRGAARAGRGRFTALAALPEVSATMAELDVELGAPVLSALALAAPAGAGARLRSELYPGEPLTLLARLGAGSESLTLTARRAGAPWRLDLALDGAARSRTLQRLWARRELEALGDGLVAGAPAAVLLRLAREPAIASALTSFVAVDPERSVERRAPSTAVPLALPAGSEMFGEPPAAPGGPTCSRGGRGRARPGPGRLATLARAHVQCGLRG
ncbi:MAG TPA: VWA domain-containing protein, partial [Polyangiaceae bacterium]|nr:VWA domain-containing protein [Polyangiaceae bacterium]